MNKLFLLAMLCVLTSGCVRASDSMYTGVFFQPERMIGQGDSTIELLKKYHFNSYRSGFRWRQVEQVKGVYRIPDEKLTRFVNDSLQAGIIPLLVLGNTNALYQNTKPVTAEQLKAFSGFVAWNVDQFPSKKVVYEIYNEWWHDDMKNHPESYDATSAHQYAAMIKMVAKVIRQHNPNAVIIAGSMNPLSQRHINWLDVMIKDGVLQDVDGISIHPYSTHTPDSDFKAIEHFEDHLKDMNAGHKVDLYISEMGYSDSLRGKLLPFQQKAYTKRYYQLAASHDFIKGIWWYSLQDVNIPHNAYESNFGMLDESGDEKEIMQGYLSWLHEKN
ncbi:glycoside hydrolase family 5 protein [Pantoea sp. Acro-805]|jgi:polysaccharide biosynthesis protein PslG|uniref:Glycoside hydrolase family 5 protein n=1 Tax=Candidatus Pantoea formicae TaxID=2608355 RepID=A0ABX0QUQ6_9GAMM|nr:cellulase family glycosylhydrolase [Pantoea formicae]MDF7649027.1 cellulase family glycosylhydrolase [Erwiniaceae bacterium L1_54_3]NIE98551.1 glycoside hydrolase family 5 protein [Pantoea formicae]